MPVGSFFVHLIYGHPRDRPACTDVQADQAFCCLCITKRSFLTIVIIDINLYSDTLAP